MASSVASVANGMFYDGLHSQQEINEDPTLAKDKSRFHGTVAEFIGVPSDATHAVRAHIPDDCDAITIVNRKTGKVHGEPVAVSNAFLEAEEKKQQRRRSASAQMSQVHANSTTERRDIQVVDIRTQPTMVFMSSGYTTTEKGRFFNDVDRALNILKNGYSVEGINPGPWTRYFSFFNVFALYEASQDSGASYRMGSNDPLRDCPPEANGDCVQTFVNNNLGCTYGSPRPRVLGCAYDDVMAVAAFAPLADVIVVIVNSNTFGGSGGARIAVINRGSDMELTLLHQLNHAIANLGDEFDYGVEATPKIDMPNCQGSANGIPFSNWYSTGVTQGCTFSNLMRPTAESCLMRRKASSMCSVCAEALNKRFFEPGFKSNGNIMQLAVPRCPLTGYQIWLRGGDAAELTIDHVFISRGNVSITWSLPSGTTIAGVSTLTILGSQLNLGESQITVTINDYSPFVQAAGRPSTMTTVLTFLLYRVLALDNCTVISCPTSRGLTNYYCATCAQQGGCGNYPVAQFFSSSSVTRPPIEQPKQTATNAIAAIASVALVSVVILLVGGLCGCVYKRKNVREVVIILGSNRVLLIFTIFFLIAVFAITLLIVIYGIYSLPYAPIFGYYALFGGLILGAMLCVIAAIAVVALYWESVLALFVPGLVMILGSIPLIILAIIAMWISFNMETERVQNWMKESWKEKVGSGDTIICDLQNYFTCSGYQQTCAINPSKEYCSDKCTYTNTFTDPCLNRFESFAVDYVRPVAAIAIAGAFVVLVAGFCAVMYARALSSASKNGKSRRTYRHDPKQPVECITDNERLALRQEYSKIDPDNGGVDSAEALRFVRAAFDEAVEQDDETELISAASAEGTVTFERIIHILFPYLDPSNEFRDPRTLTEDQAMEARSSDDIAMAHRRKHEEYIKYAGALSPAQLRNLYMEQCMKDGKYVNDPHFFQKVKAAATEHSHTVDGRMCRGLTAAELDGLRTLWARLHPDIDGHLSDPAISAFYAVTHGGTKIRSQEHFARWKNTLDVRGNGTVGWAEFCLPFAQRGLAEDARRFMILKTQADLSVLEEEFGNLNRLLSRREVAIEHGEPYVDYVFLPGEAEVPLMRVLAAVIRGDVESQRKMQ